MSSHSGHWGELEDRWDGQEEWGQSGADMDDLLFPQPPCTLPPLLHQPSPEETSSFQILPPELCRSDPVVLHTIRLLQHQRQLAQLIARAQGISLDGGGLPSCPSFPEEPSIERKSAKHHYLNFLPPEVTPFTSGKQQAQKLEVEATTARLILRKAVATICAHVGYTDTAESVLRMLTDIAHEFLIKLTTVLQANTDAMLQNKTCPFHDVMEQTLHDIGLGSMRVLHEMYRDRVVLYHARVRQKTLQMHLQYQTLLSHARDSNAATPSSRRESAGEWWSEDSSGQQTGTGGTYGTGPLAEEASVSSIKSTSSLDHELNLHPFSVHSQTGEEDAAQSMSPPKHIQAYSAQR